MELPPLVAGWRSISDSLSRGTDLRRERLQQSQTETNAMLPDLTRSSPNQRTAMAMDVHTGPWLGRPATPCRWGKTRRKTSLAREKPPVTKQMTGNVNITHWRRMRVEKPQQDTGSSTAVTDIGPPQTVASWPLTQSKPAPSTSRGPALPLPPSPTPPPTMLALSLFPRVTVYTYSSVSYRSLSWFSNMDNGRKALVFLYILTHFP